MTKHQSSNAMGVQPILYGPGSGVATMNVNGTIIMADTGVNGAATRLPRG